MKDLCQGSCLFGLFQCGWRLGQRYFISPSCDILSRVLELTHDYTFVEMRQFRRRRRQVGLELVQLCRTRLIPLNVFVIVASSLSAIFPNSWDVGPRAVLSL